MKKSLFEYLDYKKYVNDHIKSLPNKGYGQYRRIALRLNLNTVVVSQIFKGIRDLSDEHALLLSDYFNFVNEEQEYFLLLVQYSRAGHFKLKAHLEQKLKAISREALKIKNIIKFQKLTEEAQAHFYSDWKYSAILLALSLPDCKTLEHLSSKLNLNKKTLKIQIGFLIKYGLIEQKGSQYFTTNNKMHLDSDSLLVTRHHKNWREIAVRQVDKRSEEDLFFTGPLTISKEDYKEIKMMILEFISVASKKIATSKDEELAVLNIDFFKML